MATTKAYAALVGRSIFNLNNAKSALFVYVLLTQTLKMQRHLRGRGLTTSVKDVYTWISQVIIRLILRVPATRKKVEERMNQTRLDIEAKILPKGADVVRHLSIPEEGKSLEWILAEMDKMDAEMAHTNWRQGKVSGAVYRACSL